MDMQFIPPVGVTVYMALIGSDILLNRFFNILNFICIS